MKFEKDKDTQRIASFFSLGFLKQNTKTINTYSINSCNYISGNNRNMQIASNVFLIFRDVRKADWHSNPLGKASRSKQGLDGKQALCPRLGSFYC